MLIFPSYTLTVLEIATSLMSTIRKRLKASLLEPVLAVWQGGVLGLLAGMGALAIPGVGPFIAAGPIMAALSGAAVGAAIGGITGALVGMGIPEYEAKQYETKVKDGNILLSVHSHDRDEANLIKEIMKSAKADDISITTEESVSDSKKGKESVNHLDRRENYLDRNMSSDSTSFSPSLHSPEYGGTSFDLSVSNIMNYFILNY